MDYINREAAFDAAQQSISDKRTQDFNAGCARAANNILALPAADVREVVTCQKCIHAEPFERNCVLNGSAYMHCRAGRGEEVTNVWHKYKKYYRDYSVVDRDGYCDMGAMMGGQDNG